jgi:hypothetical protein
LDIRRKIGLFHYERLRSYRASRETMIFFVVVRLMFMKLRGRLVMQCRCSLGERSGRVLLSMLGD